MRGKPAIGITANFVNERSKREEEVAEISGVSYIFNQPFFKALRNDTGIDLENIVYYKCDTHYFVMCAHKQSLMSKGVLKEVGMGVGTMDDAWTWVRHYRTAMRWRSYWPRIMWIWKCYTNSLFKVGDN